MNILFTSVGRRNYLLEYFKNLPLPNIKIFAADMQKNAPALSVADVALQVKKVYHQDYISNLIHLCKVHNIDMLLSLNDLELPILAKHKKQIEKEGTRVVVSNEDVIDICFDKWKTVQYADALGLLTPKTYLSLEVALQAIDRGELSFPIVVKPRWGSGSIGIEFAYDREELIMAYQWLQKKIYRTVLATVSSSQMDTSLIIQEGIMGKEYGLDIVNDLEGNYCATIVKEKLTMRSGETDKATTKHMPDIEDIGKTIGSNLKHIGLLDADILENKGRYYVLELNPRFGGGYPFSHEAGANVPLAYLQWLNKQESSIKNFEVQFEKTFAKYDNLIEIA